MTRLMSILVLVLLIGAASYAATTSTNGYFYLPDVGDTGTSVHTSWVAVQEATDTVIQANVTAVATSAGLAASISNETGTSLAVFSTAPTFTTNITIGDSTGVTASGALGVGTLGGVGNTNNEGLTIDFETTANTIAVSSATGASNVKLTGIAVVSPFESEDPCSSGYTEGALFYNITKNVLCFCDGTNDLEVHDNSACY
jgi:hypothetical protein